MKKLLSFVLFAIIGSLAAKAQDNQEAMKKFMDYMTPGEMQEELSKNEGEWTTETTVWMQPDAPPLTSKGTCINKMILGNRYLESRHTSMFMNMPFEGIGTFGFDNAKRVFVATWIDNMGTGIMHLEGTWSDASQSLTLTGLMVDPISGKDEQVKQVYKLPDYNTQVMEMYVVKGDKETKTMEIKYTRK